MVISNYILKERKCMNFMHLDNSPANIFDENQMLVECLYEGNDSELELVERYKEKLMFAHTCTHSTRLHLRLASLKRYEKLLNDEELPQRCTEEVSHFISLIHEEFPEIEVDPQGRFKCIISWQNKGTKILDDGLSIDLLNDIIAYRFVVKSKKEQKLSQSRLIAICYEVVNRMITYFISLGYVPCQAEKVRDTIKLSSARLKEIYIPEASGIDPYYVSVVKDYILTPKENGYQSLHTIFRMPNGLTFEVQVRTAEMDTYATEGYGHHGRYKESKYKNCVAYDPQLVKGKLSKTEGFDTPRVFTF